jgi:L,D-transpeptidase YcbB
MVVSGRIQLLLAAVSITVLAGCARLGESDIREALAERMEAEEGRHADALQAFYADRDYAPLWTGPSSPNAEAERLVERLCNATDEGLHPDFLDLEALESALREAYSDPPESDSLRARAIAVAEIRLSEAFLDFADVLANGQVDPADLSGAWYLKKEAADIVPSLYAVGREGVDAALDGLVRTDQKYAALREEYFRHLEVVREGGWPELGSALSDGDRGEDVRRLRERLRMSGDLAAADTSDVFDEGLAEAVRRFQYRHGIKATGDVGETTLEKLNVPAAERLRQIQANMERRRWLPERFGNDYVYVNIPEFHLYAYENGRQVLDMPVVVGREADQTPVFADTMTYVAFSPYWNVPTRIAAQDIVPPALRNPDYIEHRNYEIVDRFAPGATVFPNTYETVDRVEAGELHVRQRPGPWNALGRAKFMFPNEHNIYLHDTPEGHLFDQAERGFSWGCVRVERPADLAEFVLKENDGWNRSRIEEAMQYNSERNVTLDRPLPVFLVYLTSWVDDDGVLHFRNDPYGLDEVLREALPPPDADHPEICGRLLALMSEIR